MGKLDELIGVIEEIVGASPDKKMDDESTMDDSSKSTPPDSGAAPVQEDRKNKLMKRTEL